MVRLLPSPPGDPFAAMVRAGGDVEIEGARVRLEFLADGPLAVLRLTRAEGDVAIHPLTAPAEILLLLADKKVAFLWPALREWAGPSLERLRSNLLNSARLGYEQRQAVFFANDTGQSILRPRARAVAQYARALERTGNIENALEVLRREGAALNLKKSWDRAEYSIFGVQAAGVLHNSGQSDAALREVSKALSVLGSSRYADNLAITRAAILTESGRYAEGLEAIDKLWDRHRKRGDEKVAGSERQFAWIRACALHGLGRVAEAKAGFPDLEARPDPVDEDWIVPSNASIETRALQCFGDVEGLVRLSVTQLESGGLMPYILLALQPHFQVPNDVRKVWEQVRADSRVIAAAKDRFQPLPANLAPALAGWRVPTATAAASN
ncbi:MAG TPA: tetratricopeptide repeat protein [Allosphingosinicella sp.]|jgi:tetratricopeptide (TPR) repeat protein